MWIYKGTEIDETTLDNYVGFVYIITNLTSGRRYIGKKLLKFSKTKRVKGKKKKFKIASDWKTYYGSNATLLSDIEKLGQQNFKREIIHLCQTKGECSYLEAKEQFQVDAILSPNYYNEWIMCKISSRHLKGLYNDDF
jgi:hypothetical protein